MVSVPKTTMDENRLLTSGESNIRFAGKIAPMKAKTVTQAVYDLSYAYLRLSVPTADGAHIGTTPLFRDFVGHGPNFLRSHSKTARCSSCPARRIWERSQMPVGFSPVIFFAPWLQVEHNALRFESSSFPPRLLSLMWPRCSRTLRPVAGSMSPGERPHIWQVKPLRSRTSVRSLARFVPDSRSCRSTRDRICISFSSRSSRMRI